MIISPTSDLQRHRRLHRGPAAAGVEAADLRLGARARRNRGARRRPHVGQVHRREDARPQLRRCRGRAGQCAPCCSPAPTASSAASCPWNGWNGWPAIGGKLICLVRGQDDEAATRPAGQDLRQRRPDTAGAVPRPWPPSTSRCIAGDIGEPNLGPGPSDLAAAGRRAST